MPIRTILTTLLLLGANAALADALLLGDAANGKALHGRHCTGCHDSGVYTRADRTVRSAEGLMGRVKFCNTQLKTGLSKDELNDVVKYLNESFYRF
jgi:mono/diheme cytochrome c family protein